MRIRLDGSTESSAYFTTRMPFRRNWSPRSPRFPCSRSQTQKRNCPAERAHEWASAHACNRLFETEHSTGTWLALLSAALPNWSCYVADARRLPRWFSGPSPTACDAALAAEVILQHSQFAGFTERVKLVNALASSVRKDSRLCLAMRFLLHGDPAHANDDHTLLFMPSPLTGQHIWGRLIQQLLKNDGGVESWRLLNREWTSTLNIDLQDELRICTADANGAWEALTKEQVDLNALEFPEELWSAIDISALLQGLFQAGQSRPDTTAAMLRSLRVHTLRNQPRVRMSVADAHGALGELFVLDKPGFDAQIPPHLQTLWHCSLARNQDRRAPFLRMIWPLRFKATHSSESTLMERRQPLS